MRCKKCSTPINEAVAAETMKRITAIYRAAGMSSEHADRLADQKGPRCRKCMTNAVPAKTILSAENHCLSPPATIPTYETGQGEAESRSDFTGKVSVP